MNKQLFILCFLIFIMSVSFISRTEADEETLKPIEVTATRTTAKEKNLTGAVTVITQEEIKRKQHMQVKDILREQLGINVVSSGPMGSQTSVFMRGANSQATLVMIDGVQVNANTTGGFDFSNLQMDNIERIEILRGPQSTLWGADAVGGVINIVTKRGKGEPTHTIAFEAGSFETFKETFSSLGALGKFDYSLSVSRTDSDGFSAANEERGATEDDGYGNTTLSTRLGYNFLADGRIDFIGRYIKSRSDFDGFGPTDSAPETQTVESFFLAVPIQKSITDWWDVRLNTNYSHEDSEFPTFNSRVLNRTYTVDFQNNLDLGDYLSAVLGAEYQVTNGSNREVDFSFDNRSQGYYLQTDFNYEDAFLLTAGFRENINSEFDNKLTYKIEGAIRLKESGTKFRAGYGTGFRVPTINDLFFVPFDNPGLVPEESKNWEIGVEQKLFGDRVTLTTTYFYTDYTNLIVFDPTPVLPLNPFGRPENIGSATSQGVESSLNLKVIEDLDLTVLHTWNQAVDDIANTTLARRPRNIVSVTLHHLWQKKLDSTVTAQYRSSMDSNSSPFSTGDIVGGRTLLRAAVSYQINENWKVTARGENLLDKEYEEPFGFGTAGISGYGGFVYTFN